MSTRQTRPTVSVILTDICSELSPAAEELAATAKLPEPSMTNLRKLKHKRPKISDVLGGLLVEKTGQNVVQVLAEVFQLA
jgi:hypothetical protein